MASMQIFFKNQPVQFRKYDSNGIVILKTWLILPKKDVLVAKNVRKLDQHRSPRNSGNMQARIIYFIRAYNINLIVHKNFSEGVRLLGWKEKSSHIFDRIEGNKMNIIILQNSVCLYCIYFKSSGENLGSLVS